MHQEVERTAMASMLDLADVLELVVDRLDERPFAQQELVGQLHQHVAHILAQLRDELHALFEEEVLGQRLRDVALVAEEFAEEALDQARHGLAIIHVAWGQTEGEEFPAVVDHQVQLEAVEPADRGLATAGVHPEDAVLVDARIAADRQGGGVHEADAGAIAQLRVRVDGQRHQHPRQQFDEAMVAHELRELRAQVALHLLRVERLEGAVARLLKEDGDGHDLAGMQARRSASVAPSRGHQLALPLRRESLPERVYRAEQFEYTQDE